MKVLTLAVMASVAAVAHGDGSQHLRKTLKLESDCNAFKTEAECAADHCVWCKCAAVPSICASVEQSQSLPPGVFQCDASSQKESDTIIAVQDDSDAQNYFQFVDGVKHTLRDAPVDGALCDASSAKQFSGYMDISGSKYDPEGDDKHLFFWFFEKRASTKASDVKDDDDDKTPLIVWLTGGPGCSSTLALLTENGPCSVTDDGKSTEVNPYSWTETAHVLWLDQPAGVGFSYGTQNDSNEDMVGEDAYYFLQAFYKTHPEYASNPLFIVGESYGGHYAPAIANRVYRGNQAMENNKGGDLLKINLGGVAVGNGLTHPEEQYKWYAEMAYKNSHGIKTVSEDVYNAMTSAVPKCIALIHECNQGDSLINSFACQSAFAVCNMAETSPYQMSGLNPYDIRIKCEHPPLCYDFSKVGDWLNLPETRAALHVTDESASKWNACNMGINFMFHTDWMKDMSGHISEMLDGGIPILIYAGDVDFICNYMGNRAWTLALDWDHKDDFVSAEDHDWNSGSGLARTANGFTFLQVYDAGHMVPADKPEVALDMISQFVNGGTF
eukprot:CAMPEP_0198285034 /NCGR_PEP_ID=MMETSP1449-20131203/4348_1 /TAXON_ID=420275 /ORGANISM="Attheya septentrionalis, Strain CCMP2084" /LENGTH=554 /DNA_ID=CAMNT_0043982271 /DNA_START=44 /DNA_END=1708 /DNA_ORIENTATION=+